MTHSAPRKGSTTDLTETADRREAGQPCKGARASLVLYRRQYVQFLATLIVKDLAQMKTTDKKNVQEQAAKRA